MGRFPQEKATRGSQRWIQYFVNEDPGTLNQAIGLGPIDWRSPLKEDKYAEYRDSEFLARLGVKPTKLPLKSFWPDRGPQWDALGRAHSGEVVLVEAKAHIGEIFSSCDASPKPLQLIQKSLNETAKALGARKGAVDWSQIFYQYANRLAHARFLSALNAIPTCLVFLYFIGDPDMKGPETKREWQAASAVLHGVLGLRGPLPDYVKDVFLEVPNATPAPR